jgi:glycerol uptake facilitator-like aquaporin
MTITTAWRRLLAEFVGTALLVTAVVGSGVMATTLSPGDVGLQLLENSIATALAVAPAAVGAYIGAAYWFTSSTSFANPAVTIGRAFTDTFAGIAPSSVPGFVGAQLVGMLAAVGLVIALYPHAGRSAAEVVVPHPADTDTTEPARTLTLAPSRHRLPEGSTVDE